MRARIVGAGHYLPKYIVTNDMLSKVIPDWSADEVADKLGIIERRFLWPLHVEFGTAYPPPPGEPWTEVDMAINALDMALNQAKLSSDDLDALIFVNCTPDHPLFSHDVMELHRHFGLRKEIEIDEFSSGCGGVAYRLRLVKQMIEAGIWTRVAVVASNATSPNFTGPHIYGVPTQPISEEGRALRMALSAYVFGDGAGALILEAEDGDDTGMLTSYAAVEYGYIVHRSGGGVIFPGNSDRTEKWRHGYYVDGRKVVRDYPKYMQIAVEKALHGHEHELPNISRFYFHQVNKKLVDAFVKYGGFPADKCPVNAGYYANLSAACLPVLISQDIQDGKLQLGSGELVLLAAMGAGIHYGGTLVRI